MAVETATEDPAAAPAAVTPNPETHDPATGKSWKELSKEHERKATESQAEISKLRSAPPAQPTNDGGRSPATRAEYIEHMRQKFIDDPVEATIEIASTATHVGITRTRSDIAQASRMLKEVKKDLKGRYEDFAEYQEEFETRLEDAPIERMTKEGLEMVFHAIRGEKLDAKLKELKAKAGKKVEEPTKIVGPTSPAGTGAPVSPHGAKPLTERQQAEMDRLGLSEETYRKNIQTRRENAKRLGVPDDKLPETMGEVLQRKTT